MELFGENETRTKGNSIGGGASSASAKKKKKKKKWERKIEYQTSDTIAGLILQREIP